MRIDVVTLFPELIQGLCETGITGRAFNTGIFALQTWNPRQYTQDKTGRVDDRSYGGGPGMVMQVQPLADTLAACKAEGATGPVVYLSPQGRSLDQAAVRKFSQLPGMTLLAGRYEGVDERLIDQYVDEEWSIGDYVLSGGELAAMVLIDAIVRLLPGALGDPQSVECESFTDGLLDFPHYTRPPQIAGQSVPAVLMSGDHAAIERWRQKESLGRTWQRRPDLLERIQLSEQQQALLDEYIREQRAV
ncbi:MAG: tRNA (guanosine(37)-N1)-methyltransferase TrmD [Gammaproteobacteria bacterium]